MAMIILTLLALLPLTATGATTWRDCGSEDRSLIFNKVDMVNDPIVISPARPFRMAFNFTLLETIDESVHLDAKMTRYVKIFGVRTAVPLPCFKTDAGSCSGSFCHYFQSYSKITKLLMEQLGLPFKCHLEKWEYAADLSYNIPHSSMAKAPPILLKVVQGEYDLKMRFSKNGRELGCLFINFDLLLE